MTAIADYFATIPSSHRALILAGGIAFFWIWESALPLFRFEYRKWSHALVNFFFTATTIVVNFALAFLLLKASEWTIAHEFGLLFWLPAMPLLLQATIGLLVLDLVSAWLAHYVSHHTPPLWKLHLIHHSDVHVDTTSANRHHPGESVVRFAFTALAVVIVGAPLWMVFLYQAMSVVLSQFNHANITLPPVVDRALSWVIVSPGMHKVHHHFELPYTDSNFGNIFSIWDRLFGTFQSRPERDIVYGIDTHMDPAEHSTVAALLTMPFRPKPAERRKR
ncbi:MAG: sterol desaturase family protein [Gemmatimonadaceae bacterium]|nr:sterol desaturase family protein [Gemmatimonadaceae bacterium]